MFGGTLRDISEFATRGERGFEPDDFRLHREMRGKHETFPESLGIARHDLRRYVCLGGLLWCQCPSACCLCPELVNKLIALAALERRQDRVDFALRTLERRSGFV